MESDCNLISKKNHLRIQWNFGRFCKKELMEWNELSKEREHVFTQSLIHVFTQSLLQEQDERQGQFFLGNTAVCNLEQSH